MVRHIKGDTRDDHKITEMLRCNRCCRHVPRIRVMNTTCNTPTTRQSMVLTYGEVLVPWWPISRPITPSSSAKPRVNGIKMTTHIISFTTMWMAHKPLPKPKHLATSLYYDYRWRLDRLERWKMLHNRSQTLHNIDVNIRIRHPQQSTRNHHNTHYHWAQNY
jgi:hypothetical protein